MLLQEKESGDLVEILDIESLVSPTQNQVSGRIQAGEEEQDPANFQKNKLVFPSGEVLPRCWVEENYKTKGL
ncbi:acetyltransferase [Tychonema sp. LEGE 07199]|uniref:acetyltransferase n=1 Tax=unclassified Tychonema TaxID=2642144 RepID=UPI00187EE413|nr:MULTISPECIES: acetyltransferase [unclassified Tychonema]MBE9121428.1 acetyltransferase [Tychonema sp. LEGE 07199]MBE9134646.1 acetyltransferase [Tychonema sp. LEGE 07196]